MSQANSSRLERPIERFFYSCSIKRIGLVSTLFAIFTIGSSLIVYTLTHNFIFVILTFGLTGMPLVYFSLVTIFPPAGRVEQSKKLILAAAHDTSRIKSTDKKSVTIVDDKGQDYQLKGFEKKAWDAVIVPYFKRKGIEPGKHQAQPERKFTTSERRYVEDQKKLIVEREKMMVEEQKRIAEDKARIKSDRDELQLREAELNQAEEMAINRLHEVETVQAELEQMRENLDYQQAHPINNNESSHSDAALSGREAALKAKEEELEKLKAKLTEEQETVQSQKTGINALKDELLKTDGTDNEQALLEKLKRLEEENRQLLERSEYVEQAESSLLEHLDSLNEREALIEQNEVNSGLRKD